MTDDDLINAMRAKATELEALAKAADTGAVGARIDGVIAAHHAYAVVDLLNESATRLPEIRRGLERVTA